MPSGLHPRDGRYDVVVLGGGGSGFAAAVEAAAAGASVMVVEKCAEPGGTTALSVGSITAAGTPHQRRHGISDDTPADHAQDMASIGAQLNAPDKPELRRLLTENLPETVRWLTGLGVEFIGPLPEPPHRRPRMHIVVPTSRAYISRLVRRARALGVEIRCSVTATALVVESDRVTGIDGVAVDEPVRIPARATVIATGDYSANTEMLARHCSPRMARIAAANPACTGDGHRMATAIGARILNPGLMRASIRFVPPSRPSLVRALPPIPLLTRLLRVCIERLPQAVIRPFMLKFLTTVLQPSPEIYRAGAILVNRDGRRFGDEGADLTVALPEQPGGVAFILFDRRIAERFSRWPHYLSTAPGVAYAYLPDYRRHGGGLYHQAATLEELARRLGMPAAALAETVADYNRAVSGGSRLGMSESPFFALGPVKSVITHTDGGLAIDAELRVLGPDDKPIPGLFAAGSAGQGGLLLHGHGHHLGWAFTSGRIAGRNAALAAKM